MGQIIDIDGNLHPEIKYYTEHTFPAMYLADDIVSFVATLEGDTSIAGAMDTLARIDLQFLCNTSALPHGEDQLALARNCGDLKVYEPSQDHLNYFLPHCPTGIVDVPGYARAVYEDAFPNIDVHFYSNAMAVKFYFVVKPGGDPNDIDLLFSGQDSVGYISNGGLAMYLTSWTLKFPQTIAYQIDASNNTNILGWLPTWNHNGNGEVTITTGAYNASQTLVIMGGGDVSQPTGEGNLDWSTYYGSPAAENTGRVYVDDNGNMFHVLSEQGRQFLPFNGQYINSGSQYNWYISKFKPDLTREWATYYGSSGPDIAMSIKEGGDPAINEKFSGIWIAGWTNIADYAPLGPVTGDFKQGPNPGSNPDLNMNGLLALFEKEHGHLSYGTYFGAGNNAWDQIAAMDIDHESNRLYIVGNTYNEATFNNSCNEQTNGSFPLCSGSGTRFYQGSKYDAADREGFIAEFDLTTMKLTWSTLFGGDGEDYIKSVKVVKNGEENALYIGGLSLAHYAGSGSYPSPITSHSLAIFPFADPGNGAFFPNSTFDIQSPSNAFVAKFNNDRQLEWSTFLGKSMGGVKNIVANSVHEIYLGNEGVDMATAAASSPNPNSSGRVPVYNNGSSYYETPNDPDQHIMLARFGTDKKLKWSTYLHGGTGGSVLHSIKSILPMTIDDEDRLYIGTYLRVVNAPVFNAPGAYWQSQNASTGLNDYIPNDNYILAFDSKEQLYWATFFGGALATGYSDYIHSSDFLTDLTINGSNDLFVTGDTKCPNSPYDQCPPGYCDQSFNQSTDCFIAKFNVSTFPTGIASSGLERENTTLTVYPNPSGRLFTVTFLNKHSGSRDASMDIFDASGRKVSSGVLRLKYGVNQIRIDMEGFPSGIYYLEIGNGDFKAAAKLNKE